jgi:hypothetical protein
MTEHYPITSTCHNGGLGPAARGSAAGEVVPVPIGRAKRKGSLSQPRRGQFVDGRDIRRGFGSIPKGRTSGYTGAGVVSRTRFGIGDEYSHIGPKISQSST